MKTDDNSFNYDDISILSGLDQGQFSAIRKDIDLTFNGVKIFYVVDTFDIIEYCFPTLFTGQQTNPDETRYVSRFLAYDFLFYGHAHKPVILEQYKVELFSVWNEVYKVAAGYLGSDRELLVSNIKKRISKDRDWARRNIGIFLSIFLGILSDTSVNRYRKLLRERLQLEKIETSEGKDQLIIQELIASIGSSKDIPSIFGEFCNKSKRFIHKRSEEDQYAYLENAYRDIVVFDRVIKINAAIQQNKQLKNKYVFLYLSSTPAKSGRISQIFTDQGMIPPIYGSNDYSLHRNISQFYFQELIVGSSRTKREVQEQLESCGEILTESDNREVLISRLSDLFKSDIDNFNRKITKNESELENTYLLYKTLSSYRKRINKVIEESGENNIDNDLKEIIEDLLSAEAKEIDHNKLMLSLINYKEEFSVQSKLLTFFDNLKDMKEGIKLLILHGNDSVRSYSQLYPVLLFFNQLGTPPFSALHDFFIHLVSPQQFAKDLVIRKYADLKRVEHFHLDSYERKLYYLFLEMIIPDNGQLSNNQLEVEKIQKGKEREIIEELKKILEINKNRINDFITVEGEDGVELIMTYSYSFEIETVYFLSWLYRRAGLYDEGRALIDYCVNVKNYNDPRLFHSRALCHTSEIEQNSYLLNEYLEDKYNLAVNDMQLGINGYTEFLKRHPEASIVKHVLVGLNNSLCYMYVKLFKLNHEKYSKSMDYARVLINKVRGDLVRLGEDYDDYPAYNHTEAELEWCESFLFYQRGDLAKAKSKISDASRKIKIIQENKFLEDFHIMKSSTEMINNWKRFLDEENRKIFPFDL